MFLEKLGVRIGEEVLGWGDLLLYFTMVSDESRSTSPSWKRERARVCVGVRREVGWGVGSEGKEKRRDSEERGNEVGFGIESFVQSLESFSCKEECVRVGFERNDALLVFWG